MKGLLVKDVCILKMQKNVLLILLAMCVVFTVFLESPTYIVSLMPMYGCIVVLGTLSYDEFDRGYSFLFTLPVSKRGYVKRKVCAWPALLRRDLASFRVRQSGLCVYQRGDTNRCVVVSFLCNAVCFGIDSVGSGTSGTVEVWK